MNHTKELVRVVRLNEKSVWLEPVAASGCSGCELNKGCGTGILSRLFTRNLLELKIPNNIKLNRNDQVWISVPQQSLLLASVVLYLVPLIGLLLGAMFGQRLFIGSESLIIFSTILSFCLSFFLARYWSLRLEKKAATQITISGKSADNIVLQMQ